LPPWLLIGGRDATLVIELGSVVSNLPAATPSSFCLFGVLLLQSFIV